MIEDFTHLLAKVLIVLGVLALEAQFNLLLYQQSALVDILRMVHCVKHEENKIVQRFLVIYGSFLIVLARLDAMLEERVNLAQERRRVIYKRIVLLIVDLRDQVDLNEFNHGPTQLAASRREVGAELAEHLRTKSFNQEQADVKVAHLLRGKIVRSARK